jgi:hypothetical protein
MVAPTLAPEFRTARPDRLLNVRAIKKYWPAENCELEACQVSCGASVLVAPPNRSISLALNVHTASPDPELYCCTVICGNCLSVYWPTPNRSGEGLLDSRREGLMILVEYPPGSQDPIHRHNRHAFVYVPEGSLVMQVKGGNGPVSATDTRSSR